MTIDEFNTLAPDFINSFLDDAGNRIDQYSAIVNNDLNYILYTKQEKLR